MTQINDDRKVKKCITEYIHETEEESCKTIYLSSYIQSLFASQQKIENIKFQILLRHEVIFGEWLKFYYNNESCQNKKQISCKGVCAMHSSNYSQRYFLPKSQLLSSYFCTDAEYFN